MQPSSSASRGPQAVLRLALAALLLLAGPAGGRRLAGGRFAPAAETPPSPSAEPNVTAMSGFSGGAARLAAGAAAPWLPADVFGGEGTAFSDSVANSGSKFACSFRYLNDWASRHFVAINKPMWEEGRACGRCITAWCVDERCPVRNVKVQAIIADLCPECKHGDIDFSIPLFRDVTGMWPHRLNIQWQFSDCSDKIDGPIRMDPKDGINAQWQAWYLSNARYPLKSATLNGTPLHREQFGFWIHAAPLAAGPATLELEAENGARLTASVASPLSPSQVPNFDIAA